MVFTARVRCDEEIDSAGTKLTSPNYPKDYPHNAECTYVIRFKEGQIITLEFLDFTLQEWYHWIRTDTGRSEKVG